MRFKLKIIFIASVLWSGRNLLLICLILICGLLIFHGLLFCHLSYFIVFLVLFNIIYFLLTICSTRACLLEAAIPMFVSSAIYPTYGHLRYWIQRRFWVLIFPGVPHHTWSTRFFSLSKIWHAHLFCRLIFLSSVDKLACMWLLCHSSELWSLPFN